MRSESDSQFSPLINLILSSDILAVLSGFTFWSLRTQFFQQRRKIPLHPHCPTYSSLLALKHPSRSLIVTRRWGNTLKLTVWLTEAVPENHRMKSRGSLRSTRESSSSGVWAKALSSQNTELQFLSSPEAGTLSLQTVSPRKLAINSNMIIINHMFSKTSCLAFPRREGHLLTNFMWMLQSSGC